MSRARALLTLGVAGLLCGGCVAAAIPIVAGGSIAGKRILNGDDTPDGEGAGSKPDAAPARADAADAPDATPLATPEARALLSGLQGASTAPPRPGAVAAAPVAGVAMATGGSAEAAVASLQAYQTLWSYVDAQVALRRGGGTPRSVVLAERTSLDAPAWVPCADKPIAILFDLDEQAQGADPDARWRRWIGDGTDAVVAVPGAVEGVDALRREGVQTIFMSARWPSDARGVVALLSRLGFGEMVPGKTLLLRGGESPVSGDQLRRTLAASYCVVAVVGDSLGDFSDLFDAGDAARRPAAATETMVAPLWGAGWFLLPNPVRSTVAPTPQPSPEIPEKSPKE